MNELNTEVDEQEFILKTCDLAEYFGVGQNAVAKWTKEGAFPYGLTAGKQRPSPVYHPSVFNISPGQVKKNRANGTHKEPLFKRKPRHTKESSEKWVMESLEEAYARINVLERAVALLFERIDNTQEKEGTHP